MKMAYKAVSISIKLVKIKFYLGRLGVQSPVRDRDKRIIYLGALNSKTAKVLFRAISTAIGSI